MEVFLTAFGDVFSLYILLSILGGVVIGIMVGAIPGLNAPMAVAIAVPMTFQLDALPAIGLLLGVLKGASFGGSISAILLNMPGTPSSAVTAIDGYAMTRQGKGLKALQMALAAGFIGGFVSDIVLLSFAAPIGNLALRLGPPEMSAILLFALVVVSLIAGQNLTKTTIATLLGLFLGCVGLDPVSGEPRLTFGIVHLQSGVPLIAVGIGMLALSETFLNMERTRQARGEFQHGMLTKPDKSIRLRFGEIISNGINIVRSAAIGIGIGILPGLGASVAAFLGYGVAKTRNSSPKGLEHGSLSGVASSESAINGVISAAMIPLLTVGVPGNVATAMLVGAFMIHGVQPGPLMFEQHVDLVYAIIFAMLLATILNLAVGSIGLHIFARIAKVPATIIMPLIVTFCISGVYFSEKSIFAVALMVLAAILGYFMKKLAYSVVAFILGFVIGPMLEFSLRQTSAMWRGDFSRILERPMVLIIVTLALLLIISGVRKRRSD